jgi:lipopolysaccharide transport system permease protein
VISLVTYARVWRRSGFDGNRVFTIDYATVFGGLIAQFLHRDGVSRALLQEYAHYLKQTMFPAEMLPVILPFGPRPMPASVSISCRCAS